MQTQQLEALVIQAGETRLVFQDDQTSSVPHQSLVRVAGTCSAGAGQPA